MSKHPVLGSFGYLMRNVLHHPSSVLLMLLPIPVGAAFKYGLPLLYEAVPATAILRPYGALLDCVLLLLTAGCVLMPFLLMAQGERCAGLFTVYRVTPLRAWGYQVSRFWLPMLMGAAEALVVSLCFSSVSSALWHAAALALCAGLAALGMLSYIAAQSKGSGASLLALLLFSVIVPFFVPWQWQPTLCWLPSYWFYRFMLTPDWLMAALCAALSLIWYTAVWTLYRRQAVRA